ncbi:MAG TPA: YbaB/EbfC family nucleoid-associated protein [Firmicutes bacterium]|jgi:DNA-binding YbaB/EbfC family protein|nr:YbaB/EbfC family nucleoid-associated protein [Bacillota bacterium]
MMNMNMQKMMKQVQKMQADMARIQEELGNKTVEATAGGGVVRVVVNGHLQVNEIHIDPSAVDPDDVEMLEDLVLAAVNEGIRLAQEMSAEEMGKVTGGMNIPGLPKGMF